MRTRSAEKVHRAPESMTPEPSPKSQQNIPKWLGPVIIVGAVLMAIHAVQNAERAIEAAATKGLKVLIEELRSRGIDVSCSGIVGAPERNLAAIGGPHIWAHAAEGVLFRHVLQVGAEANDLPSAIHSERGIEATAAASLGVSLGDMQARLAEIGRVLGTPWRADEKAATMAAWIGLAGVKRSNQKSSAGGEKT
jgi:hypothetical protein